MKRSKKPDAKKLKRNDAKKLKRNKAKGREKSIYGFAKQSEKEAKRFLFRIVSLRCEKNKKRKWDTLIVKPTVYISSSWRKVEEEQFVKMA